MNRHQIIKGKGKSNIKAWHFITPQGILRYADRRKVKPGEWFKYITRDYWKKLQMCSCGMHASKDLFDAMKFAHIFGGILCRVELKGDRIYASNKICAEYRKVVWMIDLDPLFYDIAAKICPKKWIKIRDKKGKLRPRRAPKPTEWKIESKQRPVAALEHAIRDSAKSKERCKQIIIAEIINAKQRQDREKKKGKK